MQKDIYHGIRYYQVPQFILDMFVENGEITSGVWEAALGAKFTPHPNEYLVMWPSDDPESHAWLEIPDEEVEKRGMLASEYRSRIARYSSKTEAFEKLNHLAINPSTLNDNPAVAAYTDALNDPNIDAVVVSGPAGSGKTYGAIDYARTACMSHYFDHAFVLKSGKNPLGAVKGGIDSKMAPMTEFARDALRSIVGRSGEIERKRKDENEGKNHGKTPYEQIEDTVSMQYAKNFTDVPFELAASRTFDMAVVIIDETQRCDPDTIDTLITRPGIHSKLIMLGDTAQISGAQRRHQAVDGLTYGSELLMGADNVAFIRLTKVLRGPIAAVVVRNRPIVRQKFGLPI